MSPILGLNIKYFQKKILTSVFFRKFRKDLILWKRKIHAVTVNINVIQPVVNVGLLDLREIRGQWDRRE